MFLVYAISHNIPIIQTELENVLLVNPEEDNLLYIGYTGRHFEDRMKEHRSKIQDLNYNKSQKFYRRIRNCWDFWDKTILINNIENEEDAKLTEINLIALYNSYHKGLNSTAGGDGSSMGSDNHNARAIRVYNNLTREETTYDCIEECAKYTGLNAKNISCVLSDKRNNTQSCSSSGIWYQFKYIEDTSSFIIDMKTPEQKISGSNHYYSRSILAFNNSTNTEYGPFGSVAECAKFLNISRDTIYKVVSKYNSANQAKSRDGIWFQFKYIEDKNPFILNMPPPRVGGKNHFSKRVCVFGILYESAGIASDILREVANTTNKGNFIVYWIYNKQHVHNVFYVSREFYTKYKYHDQNITKEMYESFLESHN